MPSVRFTPAMRSALAELAERSSIEVPLAGAVHRDAAVGRRFGSLRMSLEALCGRGLATVEDVRDSQTGYRCGHLFLITPAGTAAAASERRSA